MSKINIILLAFFALVSLFACTEEHGEASDIAIVITPTATDTVSLHSNEKTRYDLKFWTNNDAPTHRLTVSSFDNVFGEVALLDTIFAEPTNEFSFVYTAPIARDSLHVELSFKAYKKDGSMTNVKRHLTVLSNGTMMPEKSSIVLYLKEGYNNALKFSDPSQTLCQANLSDSSKIDMYVEKNERGGITIKSLTKAMFVKNNSYDYSASTAYGLQSVFESSRRTNTVENLSINDIVLVGHTNIAEGVFFVSNILDAEQQQTTPCVHIAFKSLK